jgi:hypothetical protein
VTYGGCQGDAGVVLYLVANGGHTWPGGYQYGPASEFGVTSQDFSANEVTWSFFAAHPAPAFAQLQAVPATGRVSALALAGALVAVGLRRKRPKARRQGPRG